MRVNRELLDWEVRISSFELASVDIFESVDIVEHWYHGDNTSVGLVQPYCLLQILISVLIHLCNWC